MTEWLPNSDYEYAEGPDPELYLSPDPVGNFEVWIPVVRSKAPARRIRAQHNPLAQVPEARAPAAVLRRDLVRAHSQPGRGALLFAPTDNLLRSLPREPSPGRYASPRR